MESSAFPSESAKIEKRRYAAGDDCVADPDDAKCSTAVKRHKKQPLASEHGVESVDASSAPLGITKLPKRTYALVFGYLGSGTLFNRFLAIFVLCLRRSSQPYTPLCRNLTARCFIV